MLLLGSGVGVENERWQKVIAVGSVVLFVVFIIMASLQPG
jgi:uncharacterized integral membrane protein